MTDQTAPKILAKTPHWNRRNIPFIIIHGIGTTLERAESVLTGGTDYEVSAHYLITQSGKVRQYLDESARAWHAGQSYWAGITDINSVSIGIELETFPAIGDESEFEHVHYSTPQLEELTRLCKKICQDHKIKPGNVLAHQDIAPYRKFDPGPNFEWARLATQGVGLWHDLSPHEDTVVHSENAFGEFKTKLALVGYDPRPDKDGKDFSWVIRAFQTHFLPWNICGEVTEQSMQALDILLDRKFQS